jgi:hypothetical protein
MGRSDFIHHGSYNVICDRCGMKRKASECRITWDNLFVCSDTCWMPRHPQEFVVGVPDDQTVPIARPDKEYSMGSTTVGTTASKNATTIVLTSVTGISDGDSIGIVLDNGDAHWTFSDGDPSGTTVTLGSYLPYLATAGNVVYVPSITNETFVTATELTATGL